MNSDVFFEMLGKTEAFVAVMAAKRPLVGVDHLVPMKIFKKSKATPACFTLMWTSFVAVSVVGKFVLLELVFRLEKTAASLALVLVVGAVAGLVLLKTGEVGVAAAANVAHVWLVTNDSFWLLWLLGHLLLLLLLKSHVHALELEVVHARKGHLCSLLLKEARLSKKIQQRHPLLFGFSLFRTFLGSFSGFIIKSSFFHVFSSCCFSL